MLTRFFLSVVSSALAISFQAPGSRAQQPGDTTVQSARAAQQDSSGPYWRTHVRAGSGGPSRSAPPSAFKGEHPPEKWCLTPSDTFSARTRADFGPPGARWTMREWSGVTLAGIQQFLGDSSNEGIVLRKVFGGAPLITKADKVDFVTDERLCHAAAEVINRDLLGWKVGPPPIALVRVRHFLLAYPSNALLGEWGYAIGMNEQLNIRGVGTW